MGDRMGMSDDLILKAKVDIRIYRYICGYPD